MTTSEAKAMFGIKDTDVIYAKGVKYLLTIAEDKKKVWSLTSGMRAKLDKEIEAYKALLKVAK